MLDFEYAHMSYSLYDQGYTAEQIKGMHKPTQDELAMEKLRKWKESEGVLEMLRQIKGFPREFDRMAMELWVKATRRRQ